MKKIYLLFLVFILALMQDATAQMSILFVDDSQDEFGNAEAVYASIEAAGYSATYYDAPLMGEGPDDVYLSEYDLVIWCTSSDGTELFLWNETDEDNESLQIYLEDGGMLWVMGLDFMYDRYGTPPISFEAGDFAYDYLGLNSYDAQSFGDDAGLGVPSIFPDLGSAIDGLEELSWAFSTLWWADAVTPRAEASKIYLMGDENYPLYESVTGTFFETDVFKVLSYFFDPAVFASAAMRNANTETVLDYFNAFVVSTENITANKLEITAYPNPSNGIFTMTLGLDKSSSVSSNLIDLQGRTVAVIHSSQTLSAGMHQITCNVSEDLQSGIYILQTEIEGTFYSQMITINH